VAAPLRAIHPEMVCVLPEVVGRPRIGVSVCVLSGSGGVGRSDLANLAEEPCEELPSAEVARWIMAG
jgi:hypothetical protein